MSETALYDPIKKTLERFGHIVTRVHSGKVKVRGGWMQLADPGTPDHHVMSPNGLSTWLETKTPVGSLNAAQVAWHERAKRNGHRVAVVRSPKEALRAVMAPDEPTPFEVRVDKKRQALNRRYDESRLLYGEDGIVIGSKKK